MTHSRLLLLLLCAPACSSDETASEAEYGFSPIDVGSADSTRAPRPRTNSQFLRGVYADVLGRAPESYEFAISVGGEELLRLPVDEETVFTSALDGVSDVRPLRSLLVTALLSSSELELPEKNKVDDAQGFIAAQFRRYLGREPSSYELAAFAEAWRSDEGVNPRSLVQALLDSREYQSF